MAALNSLGNGQKWEAITAAVMCKACDRFLCQLENSLAYICRQCKLVASLQIERGVEQRMAALQLLGKGSAGRAGRGGRSDKDPGTAKHRRLPRCSAQGKLRKALPWQGGKARPDGRRETGRQTRHHRHLQKGKGERFVRVVCPS